MQSSKESLVDDSILTSDYHICKGGGESGEGRERRIRGKKEIEKKSMS
jgi:hypothetical protein